MAKKLNKPEFLPVNEDDLKPDHRWNRPLQAPGITQVDFGPGFSVTGLTVNSATSLLVQLSISNVAPVGSTHVTVTTAGEVVTLNNGFLVTPQILGLN